MASPLKPSSPPASPVEEDVETSEAGGSLPVIKMPAEYGEIYLKDGETTVDAPAGYVTLFSEFFVLRNFWLSLTVFMAELLEYYRIHISQLSPLGMVRARHFEYCFRSQDIEPTLENFRRFYQLHVQLGFYSFQLRDGTFKILPGWMQALQAVPSVALSNRELQYLCICCVEKQPNEAGFELKICVEKCGEGEEGWYETTVASFRVPDPAALNAPLPQGAGNVSICLLYSNLVVCDILEGFMFAADKLGALGDHPAAAGGGK
ncbi:hypothetical protein Hanom_Chr07g00596771 [Helianthus anomalus]